MPRPPTFARCVPILTLVLAGAAPCACSGGSGDGADGGGGGATADLEFCVAENNRFRTMVTPAALVRSAALEAFAAEGAANDGMVRMPHDHFKKTSGGGIAFGENEIPWWPFRTGDSVQDVMKRGLKLMWDEGPGTGAAHGHYNNMSDKDFTQVGCGVSIQGDAITVVIDFK